MKLAFAPLFSGSSGNATFISSEESRILVDAGVTGSQLSDSLRGLKIDPATLDAILITHEHVDHVRGAGVLSRKFDIPIYANNATWGAMEKKIGNISLKNQKEFFNSFYINDMLCEPYCIPHDAVDPVCFSISAHDAKLSIATDLGHYTKKLIARFENSDVVLLESNHDIQMLKNGPYPAFLKRRVLGTKGHLSNETAATAAYELALLGVRGLMLAHLSQENNSSEIAYRTVSEYLNNHGVEVNKHIALSVLEKVCKPFMYQIEK